MSAILTTPEHTSPAAFDHFVDAVRARFATATGRLFRTLPSRNLFDIYLDALPEGVRQEHNCACCRSFFKRAGSLATIGADGRLRSAVWPSFDAVAPEYRRAVVALREAVERGRVGGLYLNDDAQIGTPVTGDWHHFSVPLGPHVLVSNTDRTRTIQAVQADYNEAARTLYPLLNNGRITVPLMYRVCTVLNTTTLHAADKFRAQAAWLLERATAIGAIPNRQAALAYVYAEVVAAPTLGWARPNGSMLGTLIEELRNRLTVSPQFVADWNTRVDGVNFQRPKAAPTRGNIARGEAVIAALGAERSLERRWARIDEVPTVWTPRAPASREGGGVFAHLQAPATADQLISTGITNITWARFARTVLGDATAMHVRYARVLSLVGYTTAVHADAPPILRWDREDARNPLSTYTYSGGSRPEQFGLSGDWFNVIGVAANPASAQQQVFLLGGAGDVNNPGSALFPEAMRSELREIRSTIEAHSKATRMQTTDGPRAAGVVIPSGAIVRVSTGAGAALYCIDRLD